MFPIASIFKHLSEIEKYILNNFFKKTSHTVSTSTANRGIPSKIRKKTKVSYKAIII